MKLITTIENGITTEHHGLSFNEVLDLVKDKKEVEIRINRYDDNGIGNVFIADAIIEGRDYESYYEAYDKIF